jgi:hypothetical protein
MSYRERLAHWAVMRLLPNFQRVVIARFRSRADADGHAIRLRQLTPDAEIIVLFDPQLERPNWLNPPGSLR